MAISKTKIRGKELILIEGKVDGFYINPIPEDKIKTYAGKQGPWTPTHRYNLVVDGERISLGMGDKDGVSDRQQIRVKDNDDNYHTLVKGLEVSVEVEENGEWQGKTQYQSSAARVVVLDASGAVTTPSKGSTGEAKAPYKPKDMTGVSVGHAINGAMNFLLNQNQDATNDNIVRYASSVHTVTEALKAENKAKNPDMSEYDLGASVGNSVLNAAKLVSPNDDFEISLKAIAQEFLDEVVSKVEKFVREGKGAPAAPKVTRAPAKKPAPKKAQAAEPEPADNGFADFSDMDDDSIPF